MKTGTKYDISSPEEKKPEVKEKPKANVFAGPGGSKILPPKGSKISAPTTTSTQSQAIDLLGGDAPSEPTNTHQNNNNKSEDLFGWGEPQTQTQTQNNQADNQCILFKVVKVKNFRGLEQWKYSTNYSTNNSTIQ